MSFIGILDHEIESKQPLIIDAEFDVNITETVQDSNINTVLDYRDLRNIIIDECVQAHTNLLETLVERIAQRINTQFKQIVRTKLKISKPNAFPDCGGVGIEITLEA